MTPLMIDALIDVVLPEGRRVDVTLRDGRIESIDGHRQADSSIAAPGGPTGPATCSNEQRSSALKVA